MLPKARVAAQSIGCDADPFSGAVVGHPHRHLSAHGAAERARCRVDIGALHAELLQIASAERHDVAHAALLPRLRACGKAVRLLKLARCKLWCAGSGMPAAV